MPSFLRHAFIPLAGILMLALERRRRARRPIEPPIRHHGRNLIVAGIAAATVNLLEAPAVFPVSRLVERRRWGLTARLPAPPWARAVIAIVLLDYTLYLWHILVHRADILWRFHLPHHVDLDLDATTGLRFHAGELTWSIPWRLAQVAAIGVGPGALQVWQTLTLASVLFHHSNTALPPRIERILSWLVATPHMHAIHHSIIEAQRNSNFSSGLAIWDRLHGTYRADADPRAITVGVSGYLDPESVRLREVLLLPFGREE